MSQSQALCLLLLCGCAGNLSGLSIDPDAGAGPDGGVSTVTALQGRIVAHGQPWNSVVIARGNGIQTVTAPSGVFQISGLSAGPTTLIAYDPSGFEGLATVVTVTLIADLTTNAGDIELQTGGIFAVAAQQTGLGLEERVTSQATDLSNIVYSADGRFVFAYRGNDLVRIDLAGASEAVVTAAIPPRQPTFTLQLVADSLLIVWTPAGPYVLDATSSPGAISSAIAPISIAAASTSVWISDHWLYFFYEGELQLGHGYTVTRFELSRAPGAEFTSVTQQLSGGRQMILNTASFDPGGDVVYWADFCGVGDCTNDEELDEGRGLARIVRMHVADGSEELVGRTQVQAGNINSASGVGGEGFYVLFNGTLSRVDLQTGHASVIFTSTLPSVVDGSRLLVAPDESAVLIYADNSAALAHLLQLPNLRETNLIYSSAANGSCCEGGTSLEFAPDDSIRALTGFRANTEGFALWVDFSPAGAAVRARSLGYNTVFSPAGTPLPVLLRRADGLEVSAADADVIHGSNAQIFVAPAGAGLVQFSQLTFIDEVHTAPGLSADGRSVYYLMHDELSGGVNLFRMALP
jgi:hypothetical protein